VTTICVLWECADDKKMRPKTRVFISVTRRQHYDALCSMSPSLQQHAIWLRFINVHCKRLYIGRRDVAVICGHDKISVLWGNTAYSVKQSGEDLSRYSHTIESDGLTKISVLSVSY